MSNREIRQQVVIFGLIPKAKVICKFAAEGAGIEIIQNQRFLRSTQGMPCVGNANALIELGSGHQCGLLLIKCSKVYRFPMGDYAPGRKVGNPDSAAKLAANPAGGRTCQ